MNSMNLPSIEVGVCDLNYNGIQYLRKTIVMLGDEWS